MIKIVEILEEHGILPTPQRIAIAKVAFGTKGHPSADEIWEIVKKNCPTLSRTTVYNTLNLLTEKESKIQRLNYIIQTQKTRIEELEKQMIKMPLSAVRINQCFGNSVK